MISHIMIQVIYIYIIYKFILKNNVFKIHTQLIFSLHDLLNFKWTHSTEKLTALNITLMEYGHVFA